MHCEARDLVLNNRVRFPHLLSPAVMLDSAYPHEKEKSWCVCETNRGRLVMPASTDVEAELHRDAELHSWLRVARPLGMWADIGAGTGVAGRHVRQVLREVDCTWENYAVDPRPRGQGVRRGDARALGVPDEAFGWSLLNFVLHHLPRSAQESAVREAARVSREYLVVQEDYSDGSPGVELLLGQHAPREQFRSVDDWTTLLEQVGHVSIVARHGSAPRWDAQGYDVPRVLLVVELRNEVVL